MTNNLPLDSRKVKIGQEEIHLDPEKLRFNFETLAVWMETAAVYMDYFGKKLQDAQRIQLRLEYDFDVKLAAMCVYHKENGAGSDKVAESRAKCEPEVQELKKQAIHAKWAAGLIQQHLRAWDKAHENAQSRGHFIRKEMDKLGSDIYRQSIDEKLTESILSDSTEWPHEANHGVDNHGFGN